VIRIRLLAIFTIFAFLALFARLYYWQIYQGKRLSTQARNQHISGRLIGASRGEILADDRTWLAASGSSWLVYASLDELKDSPSSIADRLAPVFLEDDVVAEKDHTLLEEVNRLKALLSKDDVVWVPLKSRVNDRTKSILKDMNIGGIGFELQETRMYPEGSSSAHLLGFVGKDKEGEDRGYFGLEGHYEVSLTGKPGFLSRESDASGNPILLGVDKEVAAIGGVDLVTHINKGIQSSVEKKLALGIEKYGAVSGTVIVMDPRTGAVLAMASYPSYDQRRYWEYGDSFFSNPAISSSFEPGSIFKVLVMSAALDAGAVESDTKCDICSKAYRVDKYTIETWDKNYHPDSTMQDIIVHSDNIGMVFVGQKLGAEKLYDYLALFGIGETTGIDLQGEQSPKLREKNRWSIVDLATASFGQGIATTPIQMIKAVAVLANDGVSVFPHVVDKIVSGDWEESVGLKFSERVISSKTASQITAMMIEAARNGEAKWTHARGFKVAGKTGTAQIPIAGHYDDEKTIASFVGFAPHDGPKFIMLVTLQEPSSSPWASETAAPLWYSIAEDLFIHFGIQPEN
jgi:cell division protein FtsI/penicillin-binding protein 2